MAKEKQRTFDRDRRVIEAALEDDLGTKHVVSYSVGRPRCPHCAREYPRDSNAAVDFDALVKSVCDELHVETGEVIDIFERHGADMSKEKAARAARLKEPKGKSEGNS